MIDEVKARNSKARNIHVVNSHRYMMESYDRDSLFTERYEESLCRYCKYISSRIGADVLTEKPCDCCGKMMTFANSNIDDLCIDCAKTHGHCKHCSQEMN